MTIKDFEQLKQAEQERIQLFAFIICASVCVLLCIVLAGSSLTNVRSSRPAQLESRINPNDASLVSLVRLPGIGAGRAEAIVAYRKKLKEGTGDYRTFKTADDLRNVKGIGPKTVKAIEQWLKFE